MYSLLENTSFPNLDLVLMPPQKNHKSSYRDDLVENNCMIFYKLMQLEFSSSSFTQSSYLFPIIMNLCS